jgi:hypothetical protein
VCAIYDMYVSKKGGRIVHFDVIVAVYVRENEE